jgi:molybdopterin-guanine dinucleotide biosynthesis protein A
MHQQLSTCDLSGIILSGGLNSRMHGKNKSFLKLGRETFLDRLLSTLGALFGEVILVTRDPHLYDTRDIKVVEDIFDVRSALSGVHAGLVRAANRHSFVVACDTPLLKPELVKRLVQEGYDDDDVVVPKKGEYLEPLCAVYSKACIPPIEALLKQRKVKISNLFPLVRTKEVDVSRINQEDPELLSFINVNTPGDLEKVQKSLMIDAAAKTQDAAAEVRIQNPEDRIIKEL